MDDRDVPGFGAMPPQREADVSRSDALQRGKPPAGAYGGEPCFGPPPAGSASPPSPLSDQRQPSRRWLWIAALVLVVAIAVGVIVGVAYLL